jgi:hypothetical protein
MYVTYVMHIYENVPFSGIVFWYMAPNTSSWSAKCRTDSAYAFFQNVNAFYLRFSLYISIIVSNQTRVRLI